MCFHTMVLMDYYKRHYDEQKGTTRAMLWTENPRTPEVVGLDVDASDNQAVANLIRNLRAWHPESAGWSVNLSHVNERRAELDLFELDLVDLPAATGEAPMSEDDEEDEHVWQRGLGPWPISNMAGPRVIFTLFTGEASQVLNTLVEAYGFGEQTAAIVNDRVHNEMLLRWLNEAHVLDLEYNARAWHDQYLQDPMPPVPREPVKLSQLKLTPFIGAPLSFLQRTVEKYSKYEAVAA